MLKMLRAAIHALRKDQRGSVAMTFGIASIPIILSAGAAVDYSLANRAKATLDEFADAAALSAVNNAAMALNASKAKTNATNMFNTQAVNLKRGAVGKVKVTVKDQNNVRTALVEYEATVPTAFMGIVGVNNIKVTGSSTATSANPTYIDFYLLLDNTPSMGVGATPADVAKMVANTPDQCAFACHDLSTYPNDYYSLAKKLGVTTRIDVVRSATQQLTDTATNTQTVSGQFRMAIYTFGATSASSGMTKVHPLSANLSGAKSDASNIDLMTVPYQNYNNDQATDFDGVLQSIDKEISSPGDGASSSQPQKFLFFVSDGVADAYYPSSCTQPTTGGRCQEPITVKNCTTLKNRGIKIAVLYTTYLALPTNAWYMTWIDPFNKGPYGPSPNSTIAQNMKSCASDGFYFEVSPTDGISDAMTALFKKVVQSARLTK